MQQSMARMARGQDSGMAMRNAANNAAGIGQSAAGQSQQAALQDQMAAQQMLGQVAGQGRQQDIGATGMGLSGGLDWAKLLAGMGQAQMQQSGQLLGGAMSTAGQLGGAAMMSDSRLKTDIRDADKEIDEMLGNLVAKRYRYKDEKHGKGPRIGVMAQDLEKSRAGRDIVFEASDGKALDLNKALSAVLASSARLHKRLTKVEQGK
jgi:hypothetical protein